MPTAANVEAFDGRACTSESAPKPPSVSIVRGGSDAAPSLPSATGRPALAQQADGTALLRIDRQDFAAGSTRPSTSHGRGPSAPQSFADASV